MRRPDGPLRALSRVGAIVLALGALACAPSDVARTTRTIAHALSVADPMLRASYEVEQTMCLSEVSDSAMRACVARVRAKWAPIRAAMKDAHDAWCMIDVEAPGCSGAQEGD